MFGGGIKIFYQNPLLCRVDDGNLVPGTDIDVLFIAKLLRCSGDKCLFPVNQTGDVIGNSSGRKRGMGAALKNRYVGLRLQSANLRCSAHSGRIATYDNEHFSSSENRQVSVTKYLEQNLHPL